MARPKGRAVFFFRADAPFRRWQRRRPGCHLGTSDNPGMTMRLVVLAAAAAFGLTLAAAQDGTGDDPVEEAGADEEAAFTGTFGDVISHAVAAWSEPEGSTATPEDVEQKALFFIGNIAWLTYHEFGHAMVSEFSIPVLGREEDAVDSFATINMIADEDDPALETMIVDVIDAWFSAGLYANLSYGEHSIDEQRGYAVICLLVGDDPEGYKEVADDAEMPAERQAACKWEFEKARNNWDAVLGENMLEDGEAASGSVSVEYGEAGDFETAGALLGASGLLETIAHQMEETFRLTGPLTISVEQCGQANAFYVPSERKVKVCYELADFFYQKAEAMIAASGAEPADDQAESGDPE